MHESKLRSGVRTGRFLLVAGTALVLSLGTARAQSAAQAQGSAQAQAAAQAEARAEAAARRASSAMTYTVYQTAMRANAEGAQLPQDIRIMQRIVTTALGEVEPPELPEVLQEGTDSAAASRFGYTLGDSGTVVWSNPGRPVARVFSVGNSDVTGFYMQGYGYLFTVKWQVGRRGGLFGAADFSRRRAELDMLVTEARRAATTKQADESRAAGEASDTLERQRQKVEEQQAAWEQWSAQYRDALSEALRGVVALYGSTLNRAQPDEAITFIADFGGGESEVVTLSARRADLTGAGREQNLAAVRMAKGETGVSDSLRTELKIMAAIIDSSLQSEHNGEVWVAYADQARYFGGDSAYQYVPGYGVLFRKAARLNVASRVVQQVAPSRVGVEVVSAQSLRQKIDESTEEQRQLYAEHLADLKQNTAEMLATYGPTLTDLAGDEWVGIYYDVGSGAGLLEGGISNFLVQARMSDIRQAAGQADGATWLLDRLVTNEKQD